MGGQCTFAIDLCKSEALHGGFRERGEWDKKIREQGAWDQKDQGAGSKGKYESF